MIALWARLKTWAALAGAVILALGAAWLRGRHAGGAAERARQRQQGLEARKQRERIDDKVAGDHPDAVRDRLRRDAGGKL